MTKFLRRLTAQCPAFFRRNIANIVVYGCCNLGCYRRICRKSITYQEKIAELMVYTGGLNIYTVMDPKIQHILETAYLDDSFFPKN